MSSKERRNGWVSEWLKEADCKSAVFMASEVRILPLPPNAIVAQLGRATDL